MLNRHKYNLRKLSGSRTPGTNIANHVRVDDLESVVVIRRVETMGGWREEWPHSPQDLGSITGYIEYGPITRGQRSGVEAVITRSMLRRGSAPRYSFPFFKKTLSDLVVRGHLLARVLGGSGYDPRNLVPMYHRRTNLSMFARIEARVLWSVSRLPGVLVRITPEYDDAYPEPMSVFPSEITYEALDAESGKSVLKGGRAVFRTGF